MKITLKQLSYIEAAANHRSLANAAQALHISKSSIAAAIDSFETDYGITLFMRQPGRGLAITSEGQRTVDRFRHFLLQARQMEADFGKACTRLTGEFAIGCFAPLAPVILPEAVQKITQRYPELTIRIIEGDLGFVANLVLRSAADVVLTYDLGKPAGVDFQPFGLARPYALLDRDSPFVARQSVSLAELAPLPMILLDLPESRTYFEMLFRIHHVDPNIVYRAGTFQTLRSFVSYGLGYALLNLKPATDIACTGRPVHGVPLSDPVPAPIFGAMYRSDSFISPPAKLCMSVCRDYFLSPAGQRHFVGAGPAGAKRVAGGG